MFVALAVYLSTASAQDHGQVIEDRVEIRADRRDLARLRDRISAWTAAVDAKDAAAERAADADIHAWVDAELAETRREVAEDRRELQNARAEAHGPGPDRGDRRDARDDHRDLEREKADQARTRAIAQELRSMQPAFAAGSATPADYAKKRQLLDELVGLSQRELGRDRGELHEDRVENRERRPR